MSALTLGGADVLELALELPASGRWHARVTTAAEPRGGVLESFDGALRLVGSIAEGAAYAGSWRSRLVAGAGGLDRDLPAVAYRYPSAGVVAQAIAQETGEVLAATPALSTSLPAWERLAGPAHRALDLLASAIGVPWRVRPSGELAFEAPSWGPTDDPSAVEVARDPARGSLTLAVQVPRLLAGTTVRGVRASLVLHRLAEAGFETIIFDRDLRAGLARLVRRHLPALDYLALYPARVVTQAADGSVDVRPDDERLPALTRVPLSMPIPGLRVLVAPGTSVLVGWTSGDPSKPFAQVDGRSGATTALTLSAPSIALGSDAAVPLARAPELAALLTQVAATFSAVPPNGAEAALAAVAAAINAALPGLGTARVRGA